MPCYDGQERAYLEMYAARRKCIQLAANELPAASLERYMCLICRELSHDSLRKCNLLKWYLQHLMLDYKNNYKNVDKTESEFSIAEAKRLGYIIVIEGHLFKIKQIEIHELEMHENMNGPWPIYEDGHMPELIFDLPARMKED